MTKTLTVTYTVIEDIEVDVKDYALTDEEIYKLAESKAKYISPMNVDSLDWEWEEEPKAKGSQSKPPDDFWFESCIGEIAGNKTFLITKDFPLPKEFMPEQHWKPPILIHCDRIEDFNEIISGDWRAKFTHEGWFRNVFKCFKQIDGLKVLGDGNPQSMGYMVLHDKLVGVLMPAQVNNIAQAREVFQFCEDKA